MPAPNELPHHGRADQACPTENEHAHDLPSSVEARRLGTRRVDQSDALASNEYCGAARTLQKLKNKLE